jgi:hypothetical protein
MKNGYAQLCVLLIAIVSMHTARILRSSPTKSQIPIPKNVKNVFQVSTHDTLTTAPKNGNLNLSVLPGLWNIFIK